MSLFNSRSAPSAAIVADTPSSRSNGRCEEQEEEGGTLLNAALQLLLRAPPPGQLPPSPPARPMLGEEMARRELLLRVELMAQEDASEASRVAQVTELREMRAEVDRCKKRMMAMEVEQVNELERLRLKAHAEHEVLAARRQLEQQVTSLAAERERLEQQLPALRSELEYVRQGKAAAEEKAQSEREANATWQAHMEETLAQCRSRLVARTEKLLQIGLQLDGDGDGEVRAREMGAGEVEAGEVEAVVGGVGDGGAPENEMDAPPSTRKSREEVARAIAAELREERDARLCVVCYRAERQSVLMPCKHAVLCATCTKAVRETSGRCPLCRAAIEDDLRVFGC